MDSPKLIEYGTMQYMQSILSRCHENRVNIYLYALNFGVLVGFLTIAGLVLYYCYQNRLSPEATYQKQLKEQDYILSKIRFYKDHQASIASRASITGLPTTDPRSIY